MHEKMVDFEEKKDLGKRPFLSRYSDVRSPENGFTLIEIMVVITILAILIALVAPKMLGRTDQARRVAVKAEIKNIEGALSSTNLTMGSIQPRNKGLKPWWKNQRSEKFRWTGPKAGICQRFR